MANIIFRIKKDGSGTVITDVNGVQGAACEDIVKILLQGLGEVQEEERKPEYYMELLPITQGLSEE